MAVRVHAVGAYGATDAEFREALDQIGGEGRGSARFRIGSSGQWQWAHASVWGVNGAEIDQALATLRVPALRVTSSDAVLWMLMLTAPGKDRFYGVHHFTTVGRVPEEPAPQDEQEDEDFPEDELEEIAGINRFIPELEFLWDAEEEARLKALYAAEEEASVPGLDAYTDYGVSLPAPVIEAMKQDPHRGWYIAFLAHASQIVEALENYGFDVDPVALRELLTVGPLTSVEQDADVGNMPRFLHTLGIVGVFQDAQDDEEPVADVVPEEKPETEDVDWSAHPPGEILEKFDAVLAGCPLTEITGGPIEVQQAPLLHLLSHLLDEDPAMFVQLEFADEAAQPGRQWAEVDALEARQQGCTWQLGFETPCWWYGVFELMELQSHILAMSLPKLPEGTRVEIALLVAGLSEQCHRYAGTYCNQRLQLHRAYPSQSADVLNDALALVEQVIGFKAIALASEEEASAVRRSYQRSQGEPPKIRNGKILPEVGERDDVVRTLLFDRFENRGPWDIAAARLRVEEEWQAYEQLCQPAEQEDDEDSADPEEQSEELANFNAMLQKMTAAAEELQQAKIVPHSEEVIYAGRTGRFLRASMADLPHISPQSLEEHTATLESLGFRSIGDFVGDVDQRQEITRCYAGHPQAVSLLGHRNANNQLGWAADSHGMVSVDFSNGSIEFHTHFEDGSVLVTTSLDATRSKPEADIYLRCYEDLPVTGLWEKHLDGIARFQSHRGTIPVDHTRFSDPVQFLTLMDALFCRFMGED